MDIVGQLGWVNGLTLLVLGLSVAFCAGVGVCFLLRPNRRKKGDLFFSLLLFAFALTQTHHILILLGIYERHPAWLFLPVYYTLSFGPLLFFAVKLWLYSTYRLRASDLKHAILPVCQFVYFVVLFFCPPDFKEGWKRDFYSPFYGAMEMLLYIGTFYAYLYAAYRYIRYKNGYLRHSKNERARQQVLWLKRLVQVLFILFWIDSAYIVTDFVVYEVLKYDLHTVRGFTRVGDISFALLGLWSAWWGARTLFRRGKILSALRKRAAVV
ncbi:MAG: hypothetical protein D6714_03410 [Bacteroidetes bacterium]|nr:MAG: hypothetical protein D6714_03410 [Bacteroidota bacterium]